MAVKRTIPRSQAIYPYGTGAILDWGQECFVVLDTRREGWRRAPRITLPRLQNRLGAADGFHLPPVVKEGARTLALEVQRFPSWLFCPSCRRMWRWGRPQEVDGKGRVPRCLTRACGVILVPMRYVAVCENGHIADVDWHKWAHVARGSTSAPCSPQISELYFESRGDKGATLDALTIRCGTCSSRHTLKDILNLNSLKRVGQRCWGRQPWQSRASETACDMSLRVLQRSQTAVHYADIVSALDLSVEEPDGTSELDSVMQDMISALGVSSEADAEPFIDRFAKTASQKLGRPITRDVIAEWLKRHFDNPAPEAGTPLAFDKTTESELLLEEWPALTHVSDEPSSRAPLVVRRDTSSQATFPELARYIGDVYLVERLREVRALRGFRRVRPDATLVRPDLDIDPRQPWLPAVEVFGEGIFLQFSLQAIEKWEQAQATAMARRIRRIAERLKNGEGPVKRFAHLSAFAARFVMVHTFSHLLMRQLCYESGYGSASVRERLYVFDDRVGVLIYTADGDSEGSLGGLVRQGRNDRLGRTIAAALERAAWCSNDPICREIPEHGFEKLALAACHACALVPETSCSHLNALLDRELVIGDGSVGPRGFFTDFLDLAESAVER
jgi:hypothetical protein